MRGRAKVEAMSNGAARKEMLKGLESSEMWFEHIRKLIEPEEEEE
jgi:hypothetical protein